MMSLSQVKVLIVDDDKYIAQVVKDVLASFGFGTVRAVLDGTQALTALGETDFDLVITDWEMLPMDGLTFVRNLRRNYDLPSRTIPVIMMTASAEPAHREAAINAGVTEFVTKPFTVESLAERIEALIQDPRCFIQCRTFVGPERRRKKGTAPEGIERRGAKLT